MKVDATYFILLFLLVCLFKSTRSALKIQNNLGDLQVYQNPLDPPLVVFSSLVAYSLKQTAKHIIKEQELTVSQSPMLMGFPSTMTLAE